MKNFATRVVITLMIWVVASQSFSQATFTYAGVSPVSVDGGTGSITIDVPTSAFGYGAVLTDINVTIQYDKTDGTCAVPGVDDSFHDQHGFELESPIGGIVTIFSTGTFNGADNISPGITQLFDDEANVAIPGGIPANGTYIPEEPLSAFKGINPEGTWTLRASETTVGDPLCILGASLEMTVEIPNGSPGDVSGLAFWLKADLGVSTSGPAVLAWTDAGGNVITGVQNSAANQPALLGSAVNGYPSVVFDGNDFVDFGDILDFTPGTDSWSFFAVINVPTNGSGAILSRAGGGLPFGHQWNHFIAGNDFRNSIGGIPTNGTATATGGWTTVASVISSTNLDTWVLGSSDVSIGVFGTSTENENVILGARNGGISESITGEISEIIVFDDALSATSRRDVETYIALKYGLTLDISSQAYTVAGSSIYNSVGYSNDIAGIGQDVSQGLLQNSSGSTSGNVVSVSGASDLTEGEFLVWGHDGGAMALTASDTPPGTVGRLTRIWNVEETGDVGTIDVSFNLTSLGLSLSGQDFALITAPGGSVMPTGLASGNVTSTGAVSPNPAGDVIVTFEDVPIADGGFFTLATQAEAAPGDLSANLVLWLDADKGMITSGSRISTWSDQSNSGFHASQASNTSKPTINTDVINSHASVGLDGIDDFLSLGDVLDLVGQTDPFSFYVVFKTVDDGTLFSRALSEVGNQRQYQWFTGGNVLNQWVGGNFVASAAQVVDGEWHIASSVNSTVNTDLFVDGSQEVDNGAINAATETTEVLIGARTNGTGYIYGGDIAEIIMFDTDVSATQNRDVETYLALKYGLTLDIATQGYTMNGSSVFNYTAYSTDIAGVFRDDSQNLIQASSVSSTGRVVEISNPSAMVDGEGLVWGHDGGLNSITTSDVPVSVTNRLERIWRLDETGDVGTVDISFNLTGMGIDASLSTISLLVAPNGAAMPTGLSSATVNSTGIVSTISGSEVVTFSGVDFTDGEYFTLGGNLVKPSPGGISTDLRLWLRADRGVITEGGKVKEWVDHGGNIANNAIQTISSARPGVESDGLNGNPSILFDGNNTMVANGGFHSHESFMVIDPNEIYNSTNAVGRIIGFERGDFTSIALGPSTLLQEDEIITYALDGGGYRAMQVSTTSNFGDPSIINPRHNAGETGQDIYRNGTQIIDTELNTGDFSIRPDQAFQLGEAFNPAISAKFNGSISEVISYSSRLSDADRRDVATYLAIKYGLTLDISSQAYTVGGVSIYNEALYANDIAGIGLNASQTLSQISSSSSNDGALVEISSASSLDDGEYLVWGNDGGSKDFTTSDVPIGAMERLTKIWRLAETGDVGTVDISFDLFALNIDPENFTLNLLIADNTAVMPGDLATATLVTGGVVSNVDGRNVLTFSDVDFENGQYFTLAGDVNVLAPGGVADGLTLWLRADEGIALNGGQVSNWADKSGNANNAFQNNASSQPTLDSNDLNGHNTVNFSNDNLDGMDGFNTHDYFVVFNPDVPANSLTSHGYLVSYTSTQGNGLALGTITLNLADEVGTHIITRDGNQYAGGYLDASTTYNSATIFNSRNNAAATGQDLFVNGNQVTVTQDSPLDFINYTDEAYRLGYGSNKVNDFDGDIAEVISYNNRLSDSDRRDVATYLAIRYGITLDISSQAYTEGGVSIYSETSYANDIAGIGQNNDNALKQTTSGSSNSGAIVTMTNPSDLDDGEYILWGNDGTDKTTVQTTELPAAFDERLAAEWVSVVTGSPGTVDIQVNVAGISDYSTRGKSPGLYTLLLNSSADFTGITSSVVASSISGGTLTFPGVTLSGTTYFTISIPPVKSPGTGNTLWLKADEGVTVSGSEVTAWADQSGNGNDANPVTSGPIQLVDQFNNNPALDFTMESLNGSAGFNTQDYFIVLDPDKSLTSASDDEVPIGFDSGSSAGLALGAHDGALTDEVLTHSTSGGYASGYEDAGVSYSDLIIINARNDAGSTSQELYVNGTNLTVNTTGTFANFSGNYSIGDNLNRDDAFDGKITEVISFNARQSSTERRDVESYLSLKYGITLDISSENYTVQGNSVFALTSYANDIAGIGSDSGFGLSQTRSVSHSTDAIVTISDASAQSDGDFIVWGNDNGATTATTSGLPPGTGVIERMTRIWGVTETGDPGTVTVTFDLTGLGFEASTVDDFALVLDMDGNFANGILSTYSATSYASSIVSFNDVDFTTATSFGLATGVDQTLDTDTDGIPDYFETAYGTDPSDGDSPVSGGSPNTDIAMTNGVLGDGISDALESILVTNSAMGPITIFTDTDGDGVPDHIEVDNGTDPFSEDSPISAGNNDGDTDGIPDGLEALIASEGGAVDPSLDTDTDGDGIADYFEVMNGTNPNDINDPTTSGGADTDGDGISDALEAQLIAGSSVAPIEPTTDTDGDGIPDYIEAQTFSDPFDAASPIAGFSDVRSLLTDYEVVGGSCVEISGYQWIHVTDNSSNLVFSINPVGNDLGSTCWGVRILNGSSNVRDDGGDNWVLNRNWYISPTNSPTSDVFVRFYSLSQENTDMHSKLLADGQTPGMIDDFNADSIKFTKISGMEVLDPLVTGGTRTIHDPVVGDFADNGKSYTIGISSFSSFVAHFNPESPATPLPVELVDFYAEVEEGLVKLKWSTATEINNDHFVVERSIDGEIFQSVGRVNGHGHSNSLIHYEYSDKKPINGLSYYRLKQVDFDGTTAFSDIIQVDYGNGLDGLKVLLYPNPADEHINIKLESQVEGLSIRLIDPLGRDVTDSVLQLGNLYQIGTEHLMPGIYFVKVNFNGEERRYRLQVTR